MFCFVYIKGPNKSKTSELTIDERKLEKLNHYSMIGKKYLKATKIDKKRRVLVIIDMMVVMLIWGAVASAQSGIIKWNFWMKPIEGTALACCIVFLIVGAWYVLWFKRLRSKYEKARDDYERSVCKESLEENRTFLEKFGKSCGKWGDEPDFVGTVMVFGMQLIVVAEVFFGLKAFRLPICDTLPGYSMSIQGISDSIANVLFLVATLMFLTSYLIERSKSEPGKDDTKKLTIFISLSLGTFLSTLGRVVFALEMKGVLSYASGEFGTQFPLAMLMRVVGGVGIVVGLCMLLSLKNQEYKEIEDAVVETLKEKDASYVKNIANGISI